MYDKNDLRSQSLELLRFPLAVAIVVVHIFSTEGITILDNLVSTAEYPFFVVMNSIIDGFLRSQSVPIYYFISGFVFFYGIRLTRDVYVRKLRNRVKSLLIPYLIWNAIAVLCVFLKMFPIFSRFSSYTQTAPFSWSELISSAHISDGVLYLCDPTNGAVIYLGNPLAPADGPLWFLSYLMIIVILTPAIYWLLCHTRYFAVVLSGVVWFILGCLGFNYLYLFFTALFFFSFGAYMSISSKDMLVEFGKFFHYSALAYPLLSILYIISSFYFPEYLLAIKQVNIFIGLIFAFNLSAWLLKHHWCKVHHCLAQASFFIYVSHILICWRITKFLFTIISPSSDISFLCLYTASTVITISLLLVVFYLMRKYCSNILKVMIGRK